MASSCDEIECGEGCELVLPPTKFSECAPEGALGQIIVIYETGVGYPLTDENSASEWEGRLNMPDSNPAKIRKLLVIGDMPASESTEIPMSNGRTFYGQEDYTINARIDEVNQENYEYARYGKCNIRRKIWIETTNGAAFGGPNGIDVSGKWKLVIPESDQELQTLQAIFRFKADEMPCRFVHPLHGDDIGLES